MNKEEFIRAYAVTVVGYKNPFNDLYSERDSRQDALVMKQLIDIDALKINFPPHEISEALYDEVNKQLAYKKQCWKDGVI